MTSGERPVGSGTTPVAVPDAAFQAYLVPVASKAAPEGTFTLRELLVTLWRGWKVIIPVTILGAVAGVAIALAIQPVYRAHTVLLPRANAESASVGRSLVSQMGGLGGLAGMFLGTSSNQAETVATLRSRVIVEQLITEQDLLPVLFPDQWDADKGEWLEKDPKRIPTLGDGYRVFDKEIRSVDEDRKTGIVTLAIEFTDREKTAEWANDLVRRANELLRQRAMADASATLEYLDRELGRTTKVELRESLFQLVEAQQKTLAMANTRPDFAVRVIDPAVVPGLRDRVWPQRPLIAMVFTALGGLLGAAIVLARHLLRRDSGRPAMGAGGS